MMRSGHALGALAAVAALAACQGAQEAARRTPTAASTTPAAPTDVPAAVPSAEPAPDQAALDRRYDACVKALGFDPGGVQVLLHRAGEMDEAWPGVVPGMPVWVKTGRNVPARFHRPCFLALGGLDPHASSYGTQQS